MPYDPLFHNRHSIRMLGYDYGQPGAYFITTCTHRKACILGRVVDDRVVIGALGRHVDSALRALPERYERVRLDASVVMPNHVHAILWLTGDAPDMPLEHLLGVGFNPTEPGKRPGLSEVVRGFKTAVARAINRARGRSGSPVWQRGFYDRIIRDEEELGRIREYIAQNPYAWAIDRENPERRIAESCAARNPRMRR